MTLVSGFEHIVREAEPLAPYTRLRIGGKAEYFAEPTTREELVGLVKRFSSENHPIRLIGSGSNVLISDKGVDGLVIHLTAPEFCKIETSDNKIVAGGGAQLNYFVATAVREGLAGPERLVGLPGTVGGALHNNTNAHGVDIGTWVQWAEVLTRSGEVKRHDKDSMSFSYRQSSLNELVILSAEFAFEKENSETLTKAMQKLWIVRRSTQPTTEHHAAYLFKDVGGELACDLIEQAGMKGARVGGVQICDTDTNYVTADPKSSSEDVLKLIEMVKEKVFESLDVKLETAIQVW